MYEFIPKSLKKDGPHCEEHIYRGGYPFLIIPGFPGISSYHLPGRVAFTVGTPADIPNISGFYSQAEAQYSTMKNIFFNNSVKNYSRWE